MTCIGPKAGTLVSKSAIPIGKHRNVMAAEYFQPQEEEVIVVIEDMVMLKQQLDFMKELPDTVGLRLMMIGLMMPILFGLYRVLTCI